MVFAQAMLQQYSADSASWKAKDAALYLVTSLASRGQTQKRGITQTSTLVNLTDFCGQHIMPELQKTDGNVACLLKEFCTLH